MSQGFSSHTMAKDANPDLFRCELCCHGPRCQRYRQGTCGYAHALDDLRPPNETRKPYTRLWRNGVHRWYGQAVTPPAAQLFLWYFERTDKRDIPLWAHGLHWYLSSERNGVRDPYPDDFGIWHDVSALLANRCIPERPFAWADDVWLRVYERHMQSLPKYLPHAPVAQRDRRRPRTPEGIPPSKRARTGIVPSHSRRQSPAT